MSDKEQLDEISKSTLKSYMSKVGSGAVGTNQTIKHQDMAKAIRNKDKDGYDSINSRRLERNTKKQIAKTGESRENYHTRKKENRRKGVDTAHRKVLGSDKVKVKATEEFEGNEMQESVASETLKPQNKSEMLGAALAKLAGLDIEDLSHYLNDTLAQVGKEGNAIPDGSSSKNQGTVNMHPSDAVKESVKTDLTDILSESEDLSEEMKEKTAVLFETAVNSRVILEREALIEEMNTNLDEAFEQMKAEMAEKLDAYLDHVVESWLVENEVAIESSLRNELTEDFIAGLKKLCIEHNVSIPEEQIDVVEELAEKTTSLEAELDEAINEVASLKKELSESRKNDVVDTVCEGLALTKAGKLRTLCESVEFDGDLEAFERKVKILKENMLGNKTDKVDTGILTEESDPDAAAGGDKPNVVLDPSVQRYKDAISRSVRK